MPVSILDRKAILSELDTLTAEDLDAMWNRGSSLTGSDFIDYVFDAFPDVVEPYALLAADLAASWYEGSAPGLSYKAISIAILDAAAIRGSVGWALAGVGATGLVRLTGVAQRTVWNANRETTLANVKREGGKWARHASANACAFCAMVSTRGAAYSSEHAAGGFGNRYHDSCHCLAVEVRPGQRYEPPPYAEKWSAAYDSASSQVVGSLTPESVLPFMRQTLGAN